MAAPSGDVEVETAVAVPVSPPTPEPVITAPETPTTGVVWGGKLNLAQKLKAQADEAAKPPAPKAESVRGILQMFEHLSNHAILLRRRQVQLLQGQKSHQSPQEARSPERHHPPAPLPKSPLFMWMHSQKKSPRASS